MTTLYDVLRLQPTASDDQIRVTYRSLAKDLHPDLNSSDPRAAERFKELKRAYDILGDSAKRAEYDAELVTASKRRVGSHGTEPVSRGRSAGTGAKPSASNALDADRKAMLTFLKSELPDGKRGSREALVQRATRVARIGPQRTRKLLNRTIAEQKRLGAMATDSAWTEVWFVGKSTA